MFLGAVWLVTAAVVGFMLGRISMYNMYGVWGVKEEPEPAEGVRSPEKESGKPTGILALSRKWTDRRSQNPAGAGERKGAEDASARRPESQEDNARWEGEPEFSGEIPVQDIQDPMGTELPAGAWTDGFAVALHDFAPEGLWEAAAAAREAAFEESLPEEDLWRSQQLGEVYEESLPEGDLWGSQQQGEVYEESLPEGDLWRSQQQGEVYEEPLPEGDLWGAQQGEVYEESLPEGDLGKGAQAGVQGTSGSDLLKSAGDVSGERAAAASGMGGAFKVSEGRHTAEKGRSGIDILNFGRPGESVAVSPGRPASGSRYSGRHRADRKTWIAGRHWETERKQAGRVKGRGREETRRFRTEYHPSVSGARVNGRRKGRRYEDDQKVWSVGSPVSGEIVADREGEYAAVVICPDEDCLYAPTGGKITRLFPMGNAFLFTTDFGAELYIQAGDIEDEMLVQYYRPRIIQNEVVTKGKLLLEFDRRGLEEAGASYDVSVCVENGFYGGNISMTDAEWVEVGEEILQMREAALQTDRLSR